MMKILETPTRRPADAVAALVGGTPLVEIRYRFDGQPRRVFAKYESMNMTGSIKDRMALHILRRAHADGSLAPDDTIVEVSSGNTGISFAAIGRALGHRMRIYMPAWMSRERVQLIRNFARRGRLGLARGGWVRRSDEARGRLCGSMKRSFFRGNSPTPPTSSARSHDRTGDRGTAARRDRQVDAFVAGVGTGGTVMGVARYLPPQSVPAGPSA